MSAQASPLGGDLQRAIEQFKRGQRAQWEPIIETARAIGERQAQALAAQAREAFRGWLPVEEPAPPVEAWVTAQPRPIMCPTCGHQRGSWLGRDFRYRAKGGGATVPNAAVAFVTCPTCKKSFTSRAPR